MFFVLPYGSDRSAFGFPWVTLAILLACAGVMAVDLSGFDTITRFGYRPADGVTSRVVTCMFVHADVVHLLGNMWFLWFLGINLETRIGSLAYLVFYVVCGVVATLFFAGLNRGSTIPLVGASGAIAGLMGAYLASFAKARINLWYGYLIVLVVRWWAGTGTFRVRAYVMLPIWFGLDILGMAYSDGGVAYAAHVAGFGFGLLAILLLRFIKVEQWLLDQTGADAWDDPSKGSEVPLLADEVPSRPPRTPLGVSTGLTGPGHARSGPPIGFSNGASRPPGSGPPLSSSSGAPSRPPLSGSPSRPVSGYPSDSLDVMLDGPVLPAPMRPRPVSAPPVTPSVRRQGTKPWRCEPCGLVNMPEHGSCRRCGQLSLA